MGQNFYLLQLLATLSIEDGFIPSIDIYTSVMGFFSVLNLSDKSLCSYYLIFDKNVGFSDHRKQSTWPKSRGRRCYIVSAGKCFLNFIHYQYVSSKHRNFFYKHTASEHSPFPSTLIEQLLQSANTRICFSVLAALFENLSYFAALDWSCWVWKFKDWNKWVT